MNLTFGDSSALSRTIEDQGFFIDDYSHLRLSYYQVRDGNDNACDLCTLHDDLSVSTDCEHGLEGSSGEISQNAAIHDNESCSTSMISLLSSSATYSSFEIVEYHNDADMTQESIETSTLYEVPKQAITQKSNITQSVLQEDPWRTRLRNSFLSSDVVLPHPSQVAAAMIASASRSSGGLQFRYNDRVEPGSKVKMERNRDDDSIVFEPKRRSTLKYNYLRL